MDTELLKIFSEDFKYKGVKTRQAVHEEGDWHETFHCWFISVINEERYIYFQMRSPRKKDYPSLLDITAAGHILAEETIADGLREVQEELGITIEFDDIKPIGIIKCCLINPQFMDNEFAHVFLYHFKGDFDDFILQEEEVSGIVRVKYDDFISLWSKDRESILATGYQISNNKKLMMNMTVQKDKFVQHSDSYYHAILEQMGKETGNN